MGSVHIDGQIVVALLCLGMLVAVVLIGVLLGSIPEGPT